MRAFDVRTGKLLWTFNTIPRPGEFGNDTWENDSWAVNGNTGVWTQITRRRGARPRLPAGRDADVGLLRRPSSRQQPVRREPRLRRSEDRPAQVALPVRAPSALELRHVVGADARRHQRRTAARSRRSRCRASRRSSTCFDRVTGQPVWPIEERPVPQSDVPGEKTSPTQPFPTKPPAYARNYLKVPDDLIDFTPELRAQALERAEALQGRRLAVQPADARQRQRPARRDRRGHRRTNWPGSAATIRRRTSSSRRRATSPSRAIARRAAAGVLGHPLRVGRRRAAVPRGARAGRLLRGRFAAAQPRAPTQRRRRAAAAPRAGRRRRGGDCRPRRCRGCRSSSRRTACSRRSTSIAARSCGRCRTATRRTTSATIRRSRA